MLIWLAVGWSVFKLPLVLHQYVPVICTDLMSVNNGGVILYVYLLHMQLSERNMILHKTVDSKQGRNQ